MFPRHLYKAGTTTTVARHRSAPNAAAPDQEAALIRRIGLALVLGMLLAALWPSPPARAADIELKAARPPIMVELSLSMDIFKHDVAIDLTHVQLVASEIAPDINADPGRLIVLQPVGLPLYGQHLNESDREALLSLLEAEEMQGFDIWYEHQLARFLNVTLRVLQNNHPQNAFTMLGLPVENNHRAGDPESINERYAPVMDHFGALISHHSFIMFDQQVSPRSMIQRSLPQAMQWRDGRPMMLRINGRWHIMLETAPLDDEVDPNRDKAETTSDLGVHAEPVPLNRHYEDLLSRVSTPEGIVAAESSPGESSAPTAGGTTSGGGSDTFFGSSAPDGSTGGGSAGGGAGSGGGGGGGSSPSGSMPGDYSGDGGGSDGSGSSVDGSSPDGGSSQDGSSGGGSSSGGGGSIGGTGVKPKNNDPVDGDGSSGDDDAGGGGSSGGSSGDGSSSGDQEPTAPAATGHAGMVNCYGGHFSLGPDGGVVNGVHNGWRGDDAVEWLIGAVEDLRDHGYSRIWLNRPHGNHFGHHVSGAAWETIPAYKRELLVDEFKPWVAENPDVEIGIFIGSRLTATDTLQTYHIGMGSYPGDTYSFDPDHPKGLDFWHAVIDPWYDIGIRWVIVDAAGGPTNRDWLIALQAYEDQLGRGIQITGEPIPGPAEYNTQLSWIALAPTYIDSPNRPWTHGDVPEGAEWYAWVSSTQTEAVLGLQPSAYVYELYERGFNITGPNALMGPVAPVLLGESYAGQALAKMMSGDPGGPFWSPTNELNEPTGGTQSGEQLTGFDENDAVSGGGSFSKDTSTLSSNGMSAAWLPGLEVDQNAAAAATESAQSVGEADAADAAQTGQGTGSTSSGSGSAGSGGSSGPGGSFGRPSNLTGGSGGAGGALPSGKMTFGGDEASIHPGTGLPLDGEGWTELTPASDARIIYVSSSSGDNVSGQWYAPSHPSIAENPFAPSGSISPVRTLRQAYSMVRDGHADWILLKRGDEWNESFRNWSKSGRSTEEPILIGSYGPAEMPRPMIRGWSTRSSTPLTSGQHTFDDLAIIGIRFGEEGIERQTGGRGWLIEDCALPLMSDPAIRITTMKQDPLDEFTVRRSVLFTPDWPGADPDAMVFLSLGAVVDGWIESCMRGDDRWDPELLEEDPELCDFRIRRTQPVPGVHVNFCGDHAESEKSETVSAGAS